MTQPSSFSPASPHPKGWKQWCCRQRQGYCHGARQLHVQEFWVVREFNSLESIEHMAKHLLPIWVLQQLPSTLAAPALPQHQLLGKKRGFSSSEHPHTPVPLNCLPVGHWPAGRLCCRLLKEHWSLVCLGNAQAFLRVAALKLRGKYSCFFYYNQVL